MSATATAQQPTTPAAPPARPPAGDVPPPPPPPATAAQPATTPQPAPGAEPAPAAQPPPLDDVPPPLDDVPPPPPAYQSPDAHTPAAGEPACAPPCRTGFVCQQGQCVSACNPPCPAGQQCTAAGECIADPNAPAFAQPRAAVPAAPEQGSERHDGFMLRATIGLGGGQVTLGDDALPIAGEAEYSGGGLLWSIDIGGSPVENLVVHGRIAQFLIGNPDTSYDGDELGTLDEVSVGAVLIGPAASYYFMPINLYVTAAVGLGVVVASHDTDEDAEGASDAGLGLNVDVGKEWWVNDQWGFGVAGRFVYANAQDEEAADAQYECIGGGVLFSATYQ